MSEAVIRVFLPHTGHQVVSQITGYFHSYRSLPLGYGPSYPGLVRFQAVHTVDRDIARGSMRTVLTGGMSDRCMDRIWGRGSR